MLKKILAQLTTIPIVVATIGYPIPAKSNPAVMIAPALCSTGVGCLFLGVVVIGGISYHLWQHNGTGQQYYVPIVESENAEGWEPKDTAAVMNWQDCYKIAQRYGKVFVGYSKKTDVTGQEYYECQFK
jgi:hypothetical protein